MKILEMLKRDKKGSIGIYILLIAGVTMLAFGSWPKAKEEPISAPEPVKEDYTAALEEKLEETLSLIEGAGKVRVMLVAANSGSVEVGKDGSGESSKTVVLNKQGESEALVLARNFPSIGGAIIVAQGGGNDKVRADLSQAAATALGIGLHRVKVYKSAS